MKLVLPLTVLFLLSNFGSCETYPIRYIVRGNGAKEAAAALGGKVVLEIPSRGVTAVEFDDEGKADDLRKSAEENGFFVEKDQIRKLIPNIPSDDEVISSNEEIPWGINAIYEREGIPDDFPSVEHRVCIVDSGYSSTHPDLPGDATGEPNDWNVDLCNHGTHVAGTISAIRNNNQGVVGVFPSAPAMRIVKAFTGSSCQYTWASSVANAAQVCFQNGAKIINMSLGGTVFSPFEEEVFSDLYNDGVLSIAAAGNSGNSAFSYPASYDTVMSVAATDQNNEAPVWSQRNSQVEIAAPGVGVKSTVAPDGYASYSGTSMATPHVAGAALVLWNKYPSANNIQIRQALIDGAKDLGEPDRDDVYGHGLLDYWTSVDMLETLLTPSSPPPTPPPTPCTGNIFRLELTTDNYGSDTSWNITDNNGNQILEGDGYSSNTDYDIVRCLYYGCYEFTIYDSYGDGICCNYGSGSYKIFLDNIVIAEGSEFQISETSNFCVPCMGNSITLSIMTDNYGNETSWKITDINGSEIFAISGFGSNTQYDETFCIAVGTYVSTIYDSSGDGICCGNGNGSYEISLGGVVIKQGGEFDSSESFVFNVTAMPTTTAPVVAPTKLSVMPSDISSSEPSNVVSLTPTSGDNNSPPTAPTFMCTTEIILVNLLTDNHGEETSWNVKDSSGSEVASGGPYTSNTPFSQELCLLAGTYSFTITDSVGDGICCDRGNGRYEIKKGGVVIKEGGEFDYAESFTFDVTSIGSVMPSDRSSVEPSIMPSGLISILPSTTPTASDNSPPVASTTPSIISTGISSNEPSTTRCDSYFFLLLQTDNYGSQTSWNLKDIEDPDGPIDSGSGYASNTNYEIEKCLPVGCYQFKIFDSNGDGICCTSGNGYYTLKLTDYDAGIDLVIKEGGQFGRSERTGFCVTDNSSLPTSLVSYMPTVIPSVVIAGCDDSPLDFYAGAYNGVACSDFAIFPNACNYFSSHCPSTCDKCEQYQCKDSSLPFKLPSSCAEVASLNSETFPTKEEVCAMDSVKKTCRETCANPHPSCP